MTLKEKKDYAYILFTKEGLTQKEIASKVKVTEKTVGGWVRDNGWKKISASLMMTREAQINMLYDRLNDMNVDMSNRPPGERKPKGRETDDIIKITAAIKNLQVETGIAEIVSAGKEICDFIRTTNLDKAREFAVWIDALVKTKITR